MRGKWMCSKCETLIQAPVPAQIIDKGIPTAGLLAQVLVSKYGEHLPLYRQEAIFERAGFAIPRSTLGQWIGECGVQLQPLVDRARSRRRRSSTSASSMTSSATCKSSRRTNALPSGKSALGRWLTRFICG